jgi:hypothetical protein
MESSRLEWEWYFELITRRFFQAGFNTSSLRVTASCHSFHLRHPATTYHIGSAGLTSHGLPYVVEVEYDGSAIFRQPAETDFTPASNVLSHPPIGSISLGFALLANSLCSRSGKAYDAQARGPINNLIDGGSHD